MKKQKENKYENMEILPIEDLDVGGMYFSQKGHLVLVKRLDFDKKEVHFHDISEQTHLYLPMNRTDLVKKIR